MIAVYTFGCLSSDVTVSMQVNPFKDRICKVFSSSKDGELTFEDFLDMMSVFSENVSLQTSNSNNFNMIVLIVVHLYLYGFH